MYKYLTDQAVRFALFPPSQLVGLMKMCFEVFREFLLRTGFYSLHIGCSGLPGGPDILIGAAVALFYGQIVND